VDQLCDSTAVAVVKQGQNSLRDCVITAVDPQSPETRRGLANKGKSAADVAGETLVRKVTQKMLKHAGVAAEHLDTMSSVATNQRMGIVIRPSGQTSAHLTKEK